MQIGAQRPKPSGGAPLPPGPAPPINISPQERADLLKQAKYDDPVRARDRTLPVLEMQDRTHRRLLIARKRTKVSPRISLGRVPVVPS